MARAGAASGAPPLTPRLVSGERASSPGRGMDLTAYDDQRRFEGAIADLIKRSELSLAEQRVRHAIGETGSASLKSASDIPARSVRIEGWDILCADLVIADAKLRQEP